QRLLQGGSGLVAAEARGQLVERLGDVGGGGGHQVLGGGRAARADHAHVTGLGGGLDEAAGEPRVAQLVDQAAPVDVLVQGGEHGPGVGGQAVAPAALEQIGDLHQLLGRVAGELHTGGEAGGQAGVGGQEG